MRTPTNTQTMQVVRGETTKKSQWDGESVRPNGAYNKQCYMQKGCAVCLTWAQSAVYIENLKWFSHGTVCSKFQRFKSWTGLNGLVQPGWIRTAACQLGQPKPLNLNWFLRDVQFNHGAIPISWVFLGPNQ